MHNVRTGLVTINALKSWTRSTASFKGIHPPNVNNLGSPQPGRNNSAYDLNIHKNE